MTLRLIHTPDWQIGKDFRFVNNATMGLLGIDAERLKAGERRGRAAGSRPGAAQKPRQDAAILQSAQAGTAVGRRRTIEQFQEKWERVFRPELRQDKVRMPKLSAPEYG
jgi:hypothetical protein